MSEGSDALAKALLGAIGENDPEQEVTNWLDTGYPPLNKIISGSYDKGVPGGRIIEMFGPPSSGKTLIATLLMQAAQKAGGIAGFSDHEYSFQLPFAKKLGLDDTFPKWIYKRPDTWEASNTLALKAAETIRKSKVIPDDAPIIWTFDSVAAMIPKSVRYDKDGKKRDIDEMNMNDTTALSRVASTTLKTINQMSAELNMTVIYLNQIRTKIGVCLRYDSMVTLANGDQVKIGKLVHARQPVEVLTVDPVTKEVGTAKIAQFHRNRHDGKWIQIVTAGGKNGKRGAFFTAEHQLLTPEGWRRADEVKLGDRISTVDTRYYTDDQHRVILGSLLGDGQIRFGEGYNPESEKGRLRMVHGNKQRDYLQWKCNLLGIDGPKDTNLHVYADTRSSLEFLPYKEVSKLKALLEIPQVWVEKIDQLVAAIWFMDDGTYSSENTKKYGVGKYSIAARKLSLESLRRIANHFAAIGMGLPSAKEGRGLLWSGENAEKFAAAIAKYVPICMSYKLHHRSEALGDSLMLNQMPPANVVYSNSVISVRHKQGDKSSDRYKYDIGIADTHTFIVGGGMVVHNCYGDPTTTPGGSSFEFYASVRLALGRKLIKDEKTKEVIAQLTGVTTKKNKITRPFQEIDLRLSFDEDGMAHFDFVTGMVDHLLELKRLETSGAWIVWVDGKKYYKKALVEKINTENLWAELLALLPR